MDTINKLLIEVYDSTQHASQFEFNEYALKQLGKVVAFDSCALVDLAFTADGRVAVQSLHLHSTPIERLQDRIRAVGNEQLEQNGTLQSQDPVLATAFLRRGQGIVADIHATMSDPQVLSYCRKYDTAHSLAFVSANTYGMTVPSLGLWRASRRNAYRKRQVADANLFIPHMLQAREINRRFRSGPTAVSAPGATALCSLQGQLYFIEDEAFGLLQREWKEWSPPMLPAAMLDGLQRSPGRVFVGKTIVVRAEPRDKLLALTMTARARQPDTLSAAERRVATLAARGLQYKEIARELGLAPATVRNQLHAVYRKMGVSNKTALGIALGAAPA